jgi:hypothetical protein
MRYFRARPRPVALRPRHNTRNRRARARPDGTTRAGATESRATAPQHSESRVRNDREAADSGRIRSGNRAEVPNSALRQMRENDPAARNPQPQRPIPKARKRPLLAAY